MYEFFIALRHITARRRQTILSVLAIGMAVMILMISQASLVGFTQEFKSITLGNLPHITIEPRDNEKYIPFYKNFVEEIKRVPGVTGVAPLIKGQATFHNKDHSKNVVLQGITVADYNSVLDISEDVIQGSFRTLGSASRGVVIGDVLADKLEVGLGDSVDVSFPDAKSTTLTVVGIVDTGTGLDESLAYTRLSIAQDFFDVSDVVNSILIRVDDPEKAGAIALNVDGRGYSLSTWEETNPEILQTIRIESIGNYITLGLILVIASFGIVSTLSMVVMEKTREIGMLMAMGAPRRSIMLVFLMESGILGLMGAIMGAIAGITISSLIGSISFEIGGEAYGGISTIPFIVRLQDVLVIVLFTFLLNLAAGVYPARRASRLDPVEAIRNE